MADCLATALAAYDHGSTRTSCLKEIHVVDILMPNIMAIIKVLKSSISPPGAASANSGVLPGNSQLDSASMTKSLAQTTAKASLSSQKSDHHSNAEMCVICMDDMKDPITLVCGHKFCADCFVCTGQLLQYPAQVPDTIFMQT